MIECEEIFDKYKNQIYSLCLKLTRDKSDAEDLFGNTWAKVYAKIFGLKNELNPFSYIYTVCINIYRKNLKKKSKSLKADFKTEKEYNLFLERPDTVDVENKTIEDEEKLLLKKAIDNLNDKYRVPLILFYYRDCSYNDVANILKLPVSTVKYRLSFAKSQLSKILLENDKNG